MLIGSHCWLLSTWASLAEVMLLSEYQLNRHAQGAVIFKHLVTYFSCAPCTPLGIAYPYNLPVPVASCLSKFSPAPFLHFSASSSPCQTCKTAARLGKWSMRTSACLDCDKICNVRYGYTPCYTGHTMMHYYTPSLTMTTGQHTITHQYTPGHSSTHHTLWHTTGMWSFWIEKVYIGCLYRSTACNCCCVFCTF